MSRWSIYKAISFWEERSGSAHLINWPQCIPGKELLLEDDEWVRDSRTEEYTMWLSKSSLLQTENSGWSFRVKSSVLTWSSEGSDFPDVADPFAFSRLFSDLRRSTMGSCGFPCRPGTKKRGRRGGSSSKWTSSMLSVRSSWFKQNQGELCNPCLAMWKGLEWGRPHLRDRCLREIFVLVRPCVSKTSDI